MKTTKVERRRPVRSGKAGGTGARAASTILGSVHGSIRDLHRGGLVDQATMREFDAMCLTPVEHMKAKDILALRRRERVSQPVFAAHLNVRKHTVSRWERGEAVPEGAALKLLDVVKRKGLKALV